MRNDSVVCFECGQEAEHRHHVVPRVLGGTQTLPLCRACHAKVHSRESMAHSSLTKAGLQKARERGVKLGGALPVIDLATESLILSMRESGQGYWAIAKTLNSQGVPTARGRQWYGTTIQTVVRRNQRNQQK